MKFQKSPSFHGASCYNGFKPRNLSFKKVVKQVMREQSNSLFMTQIENMMRRIVQEELRRLQPLLSSSSWTPIEQPRSEPPLLRPRYKLRFINSPPPSIFTGFKIEAEDDSPIAIELVDTTTNTRVVSGQYSSSRVEIVPLNADFTDENWTVERFKRNILKQREGKRPLLTGDLTLTLKNGVGVMAGDVTFSDNSSWTRSRKFRLGARLSGGGAMEARSKAFECKDQRGESYKKHNPPHPSSEIWRLKKIAKDGVLALRLRELGISTVKDFRRWLATNPTASYKDFGGKVSKKTWETIVYQAMCCILDETECYMYNTNTHEISLVFNSVFELIKVSLSPGGPFRNVDELINYQPVLDSLKLEAYQNINRFKAVNGRAFVDNPQRSLQCSQDQGFGITCPGSQHRDFQGTQSCLGTLDPSDSSMSLYLTTAASTVQPEMQNFDNTSTATFHIDKKFVPNFRNSFRVSQLDPVYGESQTVVTRDYTENEKEENSFVNHLSSWSPGTERWNEQTLEGLCVSVSGTEEAGTFDLHFGNMVGSPRARWCKVKAAFKLREVWKLTTARNRLRGSTCHKPVLPY